MRPSCLVTVLALAYACAERPKALHTSRRSSSVTCGDVARDTSHRAFAAIERLATTRDEVRILVYGQSISEQSWWLDVRTWLRAQYPEGTLRMEEHARGGCSAQCLIGREPWDQDGQRYNRVPEDVFAWRPDLLIFHVFGRHDDYETLVRGFKEGCAAFAGHEVPEARCQGSGLYPDYEPPELLIFTYHRVDDRPDRALFPLLPPSDEREWDGWMSSVWIPRVAEQVGATVVPVWQDWRRFLDERGFSARDLLIDDVHLNEAGNALLASMIKPFLCYVPAR